MCRRLCNVKERFGLPGEYLNPNAIPDIARRLTGSPSGSEQKLRFGQYLRGLGRIRTTADGCFGIKVQPKQLLAVLPRDAGGGARFLQNFEKIVVLTRRDKLGQAISGSIADETGKWFSDGSEAVLDDSKLAALCPDVAFKLNRYIVEERLMLDAAQRSGKPVLHLEYEEILGDPDAVFNRVLGFLGEPRGVAGVEEDAAVPVPSKPKGKTAQRLRTMFLDFIAGGGPDSKLLRRVRSPDAE